MDLRELAVMTGDSTMFREKLEGLVELRRRKSAFMQRMRDVGLARAFQDSLAEFSWACALGRRTLDALSLCGGHPYVDGRAAA